MRGTRASALLGAALLVVLALDVGHAIRAGAGPAQCAGHLRGGQWTAVPAPRGAFVTGEDDVDRCRLTTSDGHDVFVSADGGAHWTRSRLPTHGPVTSVWTEGLGPGVALIGTAADATAGVGGQVMLSTDGGLSFSAVTGLPGDTVLSAATAGGASVTDTTTATVYVLASNTGQDNTLYVSTDSGQTFMALPQSPQFVSTRMAVDPTNPQVVWLNATAPGSAAPVWRSTDGGETFTAIPVPGAQQVNDITLGPRDDGLVEAYVATDSGVFASDSDGAHWWRVDSLPHGSTAARVAPDDYRVLTVLSRGLPYRDTVPQPFQSIPYGLGDCGLYNLSVNRTGDLLGAGCNGRPYRYADDTTAHSASGSPNPAADNPAYAPAAALPLVPAQTWSLPHAQTGAGVTRTSGTIAFDGRVLYYLGDGDPQTNGSLNGSPGPSPDLMIYRIDAKTGAEIAPIRLHLGEAPKDIRTDLSYDTRRDRLLIVTGRGVDISSSPGHTPLQVLSYDVRRDRLSRLFFLPNDGGTSPFVEPDPSTGGYLTADTNVAVIADRNAAFKTTDACSNTEVTAAGGAALTPAGDGGGAYVEMEDDQTVIRVDPLCRTLQRYAHRLVSEAFSEDDALACDGEDFPLPALWLRDAAIGTVTAWLAPGAFCPLPSRLTIVPPTPLHPGQQSTLCALLASPAAPAVPGVPVSIAVDGQQLGYPTTTAGGLACVPYRAGRPGAHSVVARFFGRHSTPQLLSSSATAVVTVIGSAGGEPGLPRTIASDGPAAVAAAAPVSGPAAPAQPAPNPQPQAQSQAQSQTQSAQQTNSQTGAAYQEEEELQLAYATDDGRRQQPSPGPGMLLMSAAVMTAATAAAVARRRQYRKAFQRWR